MDDLVVFHRHPDGIAEMQLVRTERLDHVAIDHHRCSCGSQRAIVSRVRGTDVRDTVAWPFPQGRNLPGEVPS